MTILNPSIRAQIRAADAFTANDAADFRPEDKDALLSVLNTGNVSPNAMPALARLGISRADLERATADQRGLGQKLASKLADVVQDPLFGAHEVKLLNAKIGDHAALGLQIKAQVLADDDPLVKDDRVRSQSSGASHKWVSTGFGAYPSANLGRGGSIGPATFSGGFTSNGAVSVTVLRPYDTRSVDSALALARANTTDLPLTAQKARTLEPGSQIDIRGRGKLGAHARLGVGQSWSPGEYLDVGFSAGVSTRVSTEKELSVRVKRLEGEKVYVSVSQVDTRQRNVALSATAGIDLHADQLIPNLGGGLIQRASDLAQGKVENAVENWLRADLRASHHRSNKETEMATYEIDLGQSKGRKAYDALMKLDLSVADQEAAEGMGFGPVRTAKFDEQIRSRANALSFSVGPATLLNIASSRTQSQGSLKTAQGEFKFHKTRHDRELNVAILRRFTGVKKVQRELIDVQKPGEASKPHYHLRFTAKGDRRTSSSDVLRFLMAAQGIGALSKEHEALLQPSAKEFRRSFGTTDRTVDVFFPPEGLQSLAQRYQSAPQEVDRAIEVAYADAYAAMESPSTRWARGPFEDVKAPWLVSPRRFAQVQTYLAKERPTQRDKDDYAGITGRNLWEDGPAYREMSAIKGLVKQLSQASDATGRAEVFMKLVGELDIDPYASLYTVGNLLGPEGVLVNEMSLKNTHDSERQTDLVLAREGAIQDPRVAIQRIISDPS